MSNYKAAMRGVDFELQTTATTGNGRTICPPSSFNNHRITIKGIGAVEAGAIQIESANDPSYSGTWNPVGGGPIAVPADSELEYNFQGNFAALRARISTTVTVGTTTVTYNGHP